MQSWTEKNGNWMREKWKMRRKKSENDRIVGGKAKDSDGWKLLEDARSRIVSRVENVIDVMPVSNTHE